MRNGSRATPRRKSSAVISRNFIPTKTGPHGEPQRALETAKREGKFEKESWRVRKDGSRFWAHVVIDPLRDETGTLLGFAKITKDISERREAQMKLDKTREALNQSQKMEAIGHLTGGIAHDFNNLLMAVLSSLELIRKRLPEDPKLTALLDNAMQGAERGAALTKRMLAFARRQELNTETIDIPDLVRGMSDMLQRSLGQSISIETRFPLKLSPIVADANQLEMALLNLAVNARDAMPQGGQIIIAAAEENLSADNAEDMKPGQYVRLSVTDAAKAWMRKRSDTRPSRSSRPKARVKAPVLACRWCMASPNNLAAASTCAAGSAKARPRKSGCRPPRVLQGPRRQLAGPRQGKILRAAGRPRRRR